MHLSVCKYNWLGSSQINYTQTLLLINTQIIYVFYFQNVFQNCRCLSQIIHIAFWVLIFEHQHYQPTQLTKNNNLEAVRSGVTNLEEGGRGKGGIKSRGGGYPNDWSVKGCWPLLGQSKGPIHVCSCAVVLFVYITFFSFTYACVRAWVRARAIHIPSP